MSECVPLKIKKINKFRHLILRKNVKIVATRCRILKLKCTQIDFS